ncbi:MAG: ABC-type multidrug transport system fused ATPase/permease subunit [Candidatus Paceibacteria bacterium]|jgi:ABC-type multidrug transport system fused ATPase/permease subunit
MKADVRTTWLLLWPFARRHAVGISLIFFFGGLAAIGERSVLLLLSPAFEAIFGPMGDAKEAAAISGGSLFQFTQGLKEDVTRLLVGTLHPSTDADRMEALYRVGWLVFAIAIFSASFQYAFTWMSRKVALLMVVDLRMKLASHLMRLSMRYHDSRKLGDVLSRISADVGNTLAVLNEGFRNLIFEPLSAVASLGYAFMLAPKATLAMLIGLPLVILPVSLLSKKVRKGSARSLNKLGASVQVLSQMFQGIRTVKAFRAEKRELDNFARINTEYVTESMKMVKAISLTNSLTLVISHAGLGAVVVFVGWLQIREGGGGSAAAGDMLGFFLAISNVYTNIKKTTRMWTRVQESVGASERLQELLDVPEDIVESKGAHELDGLGAGICLEHVSFHYPEGDGLALDGIDLEIRPGETLALVGASGGGKSTLIDLLARFRDPVEGRLTAGGHDLREVSFDSWADHYAMVGQTPFLFHASIEQNIGYGKPGATREEIHEAARAADIHDFIMDLPDQYDTDVADMGARLSGGQRQRITIARAILKGAPLLLLDEATSALDTETEVKVQEALDVLCAGRTVVVIAHRLSTIRTANRIAVLVGGRIVEIGSHEELLAKEGAYAGLHQAQFKPSDENGGDSEPG